MPDKPGVNGDTCEDDALTQRARLVSRVEHTLSWGRPALRRQGIELLDRVDLAMLWVSALPE